MSEEVMAVGWDAIDEAVSSTWGAGAKALRHHDSLFIRWTRPFGWYKCL